MPAPRCSPRAARSSTKPQRMWGCGRSPRAVRAQRHLRPCPREGGRGATMASPVAAAGAGHPTGRHAARCACVVRRTPGHGELTTARCCGVSHEAAGGRGGGLAALPPATCGGRARSARPPLRWRLRRRNACALGIGPALSMCNPPGSTTRKLPMGGPSCLPRLGDGDTHIASFDTTALRAASSWIHLHKGTTSLWAILQQKMQKSKTHSCAPTDPDVSERPM